MTQSPRIEPSSSSMLRRAALGRGFRPISVHRVKSPHLSCPLPRRIVSRPHQRCDQSGPHTPRGWVRGASLRRDGPARSEPATSGAAELRSLSAMEDMRPIGCPHSLRSGPPASPVTSATARQPCPTWGPEQASSPDGACGTDHRTSRVDPGRSRVAFGLGDGSRSPFSRY
jgi:hypothetical protein